MSSASTENSSLNYIYGEVFPDIGYPFDFEACETLGSEYLDYRCRNSGQKQDFHSESENDYSVSSPLWDEDVGNDFCHFKSISGEQMGSTSSESLGEKTSSISLKPERVSPEARRRSLFVHSCPSHFSDINRARKSVFGSIFLRTTGRVAEEVNLLKTITDSNYSMLQSLLNSFEKILSLVPSDSERKQMMVAYKESVVRMLENHGIRRTYSDGSIHWDIYPIAQSYLFSLQVEDRVHQTRNLSKIEERIISGTTQNLRTPYEWPTSSVWSGNWDGLGMSGSGTYTMPHGVQYNGKMKDGMFHDNNATVIYPNKFKAVNCVYDKGILKDCQFQFPDMLLHENENWTYCKYPDRRFWSEVRKGFKPAKIAQKTELDPPRKIPAGCYDTNDGFYNPKTLALHSPTGDLLRVPVCGESLWIKKYCRKGFLQPTGFRPDLYENWFDGNQEFIDEILKQHENYRLRKITYDDLQQFYADHDLLSSCSKYQKVDNLLEMEGKEYKKTVPEPVKIKSKKELEKYKGHKLSELLLCQNSKTFENKKAAETPSMKSLLTKKSKSFIKFNDDTRVKSVLAVNSRMSKINFKISSESLPGVSAAADEPFRSVATRSIPDVYLTPQPIQRPPFQARSPENKLTKKSEKIIAKCPSKQGSEADLLAVEMNFKHLQKKRLLKFMKDIILDAVTKALLNERDRQRRRLLWASRVPPKQNEIAKQEQTCLNVLEKLFESIPDREEYTDSDPLQTCDFRKLTEDKHNTLKYWGKRLFTLDFKNVNDEIEI